MRRHERWWWRLMRDRRPVVMVFILPYWFIKLPAFLLALLLRHAAEKHADRMKT